ncbi:methyltransferase family protein [Azohydromonas caseinilytica]|uniref:Isoprenylcysteine carboxylmethyltransferase family protein n=1 Tax=Azohydromonas caseinilytica TaxID=2728836 RepID=A0A848FD33_9BURK|nr:isoprenylcysteine carboxylmethyltransferase family protein [Azohydromonas caseinilytica]NML16896.1 isoprenylcysteine carboxylmethyltransferase family protein [Azohydromonas caseinilytica]
MRRDTLLLLELRIPPVLLVLITGAGMFLLARAFPRWTMPLPGRVPLALALAATGAAVALAGVAAFRRARTTVNPITPQASSALVVSGVYRFSRNPMYLGFLLLLCGWAVLLAHAPAALLLPLFVAWMNRFQIRPEERALAARFGDGYAAYARRVRRWL